jgi:hypothetical protein
MPSIENSLKDSKIPNLPANPIEVIVTINQPRNTKSISTLNHLRFPQKVKKQSPILVIDNTPKNSNYQEKINLKDLRKKVDPQIT